MQQLTRTILSGPTLSDFAARNCLVTRTNTVKVGDYGTSRERFKVSLILSQMLHFISCSTPSQQEDYYARKKGHKAWPVRWMAPEMIVDREGSVLDSKPASLPANVW